MKAKKILSLFIAISMLFSCFGIDVMAAETTSPDATNTFVEEAAASVDAVAKIGGDFYTSFEGALEAANAMTGDVIVEIYDKVTLTQNLSGMYDSIVFAGKDTDAEIYLDVQGYIEAPEKDVTFENLMLSKSAGGFIGNAGFMNVAFGVYAVNSVSYNNCFFSNGAYASSGKNTFTNCIFKRSHDKYGLWAYGDVEVVVDSCTFADYRGIKMYAEGAAKTANLTVKNTDFSALDSKPAIVLTYGESIILEGNTYSSTGVFELDLDGEPNGTLVTSDVDPVCKNDNGDCGVLVDGKIYTTVEEAAEAAESGSTVILLHNSTETVELPEGVILNKNGFEAAGVTTSSGVTAWDGVTITNLDELKMFHDAVNSGDTYKGKTVTLTTDIDLANENWTPIGSPEKLFLGTFDGGNHTISNLVIEGGSNSNQGFFGVTQEGEIKNLTINNAKVSGRLNVGVLAGTPYTSKYTNINLTGHVEVNGFAYVGGVGGKNAYANWTDITVDVDNSSYVKAVSTENGSAYRTYVGGVIGFNGEGNHTFKNITSNIDVIGDVCDIGGIFGIAHYGNNFENVICSASVTGPEGEAEVGGIAGVWHNEQGYTVTFTNCKYEGSSDVSAVGAPYSTSNKTSETSGTLIIDGAQTWPVAGVAKIGDVAYTTLQDALKAATEGCTITLLDDITVSEAWDCRNNGAKVTVPVTIDGNGKKLKLTGEIKDNNWNTVFRFESDATVKNLTIDVSEATGVQRGITSKLSISAENVKIIGNNLRYGIIFGEGAGAAISDVTATIANCEFTNCQAAVSDNANGQDAKSVIITDSTFNNASAVVSARETITFTGNNVIGEEVNLTSYAAADTVTVTATDNTLSVTSAVATVNPENVTADAEFVTSVAKIDSKYYLTFEKAINKAKENNVVTLVSDIAIDAPIKIDKSISIDGNGHKLTQSAICNNEYALLYFDGADVLDVTVKNVIFDEINGGAAIRTLGANTNIDNCIFQNGDHSQIQGLVRLTQGSATIKNSKFLNNICSMAVSFNYDTAGIEGDTFIVDNCVFDGNTSNGTAIVYYVKGAGCEVKNSEFKNNKVNCNTNGATIYLGFQENCAVTGNLFENNSVVDSSDSTRVAGAVFFGYEANISGNAFVNNTASNVNGDALGQHVCTSTYYDCVIDLSDNYFDGQKPNEGEDYFIQHKTGNGEFALNSYYTEYTFDENGNVVLSGKVVTGPCSITPGYTSQSSIWGEGKAAATESYVVKLYVDETVIATASLNDVDNIIDGTYKNLTWSIPFAVTTDPYWTVEWVVGYPSKDAQPTRVELWVDGEKKAENTVKMSGPDDLNKVVWKELEIFNVKVAKIGDTEYETLEAAINAAKDGDIVTLLDDITITKTVVNDKKITLDLAGFALAGMPQEAEAYAVIENLGELTVTGDGEIICEHQLAGSTGYAVNTIHNRGTLVIGDATIENKSTATNQIGYAIDNNSTISDAIVIVNGGIVKVSGSNYYDGIRQFCNSQTAENSVTVTGGEVSSIWLQNPSDGASGRNTKDVKGSISITGGKVNALYLEPSAEFSAIITDGEFGTVGAFENADGRDLTGFISGGTFKTKPEDMYVAEGFEFVLNDGNTFGVRPVLPTATVTDLENDDLTFALNFKADESTDEQLDCYGDWYADFVLTVNKDVTFNAEGGADGWLSGQYDAWSENWVNVPFEDVTLKAGESLKIMEYAATLLGQSGLKLTYNDVYSFVKDFNCGVYLTEEFLSANPDFEVTLELRMYNTADETESYAIGETYVFEAPSFVASVTDSDGVETNFATLAEAVAAAQNGETVTLLKDFTIASEETIILDGVNLTVLEGVTLTNSGELQVTGEVTLNIASYTGSSIDLLDGAIIKDSTVEGPAYVSGGVTFRGNNTFTMITDYGDYYSSETPSTWTVEEGASVTLTKYDRYGLGYGDKITVYGTLTDGSARSIDRTTLTPADASINMYGGLVGMTNSAAPDAQNSFTAENAYLRFGFEGDKSFGNKPGNYYGNYTFTFDNVVMDSNGYKFYEDKGKSVVTFKNSNLLVNGILMTNDANSTFVYENTTVYSKATSNGSDDKNQNAGLMKLVNSDITYNALVTNIGTIEMDAISTFNAPSLNNKNGTFTIDAAGFDREGETKIVDLSSIEGTITVINVPVGYEVVYGTDGDVTLVKNAKSPAGKVSYRAYITDTDEREAVQVDLENVYAAESFVVKLLDSERNVLTTTTLKSGGVDASIYTANIVLSGKASGSWDTVIHEKLTSNNVPATIQIWADDILVDTYENAFGKGTNVDLYDKYIALDCVEKEKAVKVIGNNVRLQDLIKIGFYFAADADVTVAEAGGLLWTAEEFDADGDHTINSSIAKKYTNLSEVAPKTYVVETDGVFAYYIDQEYCFVPYIVTTDGEYKYGDVDKYSVMDYAKVALNSELYKDTHEIVSNLLNYATYAREYFGYAEGIPTPDELFNSILTEEQKELGWDESLNRSNSNIIASNGTFEPQLYGHNANILAAISLSSHYRNTEIDGAYYWDSYENVNDISKAKKANTWLNNKYYTTASIEGLYAYDIYDEYYVCAYDDEKGMDKNIYSVNVAAYLTDVINAYNNASDNASKALVKLCKAMQVYGFEANTYFASEDK